MGAGVFKQSNAFLYRFQRAETRPKPQIKTRFLFKKITAAFREHSLFLLVFKKVADIAIQKTAKRFKVIPRNTLPLSQFLDG